MDYTSLKADSKSMGETNDCAVMATSVVTDCEYHEAHAALKAEGRKVGKGTYFRQYTAAINKMGFNVVVTRIAAKTMRSAEAELRIRFPGQKFLVRVNDHVAGFDGEKIVDWSRGCLHRIMDVYCVTRNSGAIEEFRRPKTTKKLPKQAQVIYNAIFADQRRTGRNGYTVKQLAEIATAYGLKTKQDPIRVVKYYKAVLQAKGMVIY